ncbi:ATP-binding protein [Rubrivivax gelatinosus]|uniref:Rad50/SbcC-type AAA domain-containing protein n=1 Tax=Rubrivivax gelatinosus TaxID=28068 RepID=A0ABS1E341_RUBGE|nr:AAA family ATPase [Rubrivivax gelatinosus]MBK1715816.1 hypothetical protein [Rubrivivax gelatinosus]
MKITRLRVAELRRFREPFEISGLAPGLNVFAAPNESGKSTLVRAIRAAFFERHRSSGAEDLRSWGDSAAAPTVELDFTLGGSDYRLVKSFLQKKRCELVAGARRWEGAEAEDHLAELLGFEYALKGASGQKHWGIPGLLWVEQGTTQAIAEPVEHAAAHLQRALNASLGEVAATGGDEVLDRVRLLRRELLTATGRPTGPLAEAQRAAEESAERVAEIEAAVHGHAERVDRLKRQRDEHEAETREAPWLALRQQLAQAETALATAEGLQREHDAAAATLRQADGLAGLLRQQIADDGKRQQELATREATRAAAQRRHEAATGAEAQRRQQLALADAQAQQAAAQARLEAVQTRIAAARLDILRQDVERLRRSADEAERAHRARELEVARLTAELAAVGAQGLDEQLAGEHATAEHAARRRDELQRRAAALDLLLTKLEGRRQALTRRLQAPLQKHLDHYASLLFPAGRLEVGESLRPEVLARPGLRGEERGAFETLSFGAREQLGLVCRLAYADLLREAGRPTLVILDDALVHTDTERLERMKRIVFDAAQRHQLLVFSCHPAQWRDMGVPVRRLDTDG